VEDNKKGIIQALSAIALFGTLPVAIRFVSANTFSIGIFRLCFALIFVYGFCRIKGSLSAGFFKHWKFLVPIGVCFGLHWYTYFQAIKIASASIGAVSVSTYGIHLIILGFFFERRPKTWIDVGAVFLAIAGTLLIIPEFSLGNDTTLGFCYGVISGFLYALLPILHKRASFLNGSTRTLGQFFFALLVFLPFFGETNWELSRTDWLVLLHLGFVCTVVGHSLWVAATTILPTATSALVYYAYVPTALFFSYILLGEELRPTALFGVFLVFTANITGILYGSTFKKPASEELISERLITE
jgi:drug/metabolite transporter (DMT)-like permease